MEKEFGICDIDLYNNCIKYMFLRFYSRVSNEPNAMFTKELKVPLYLTTARRLLNIW